MNKISFQLQKNERLYGLSTALGYKYPIDENSDFTFSNFINRTDNQTSGILFSNYGKYFHAPEGLKISAKRGAITLEAKSTIVKKDNFKNMAAAFADWAKTFAAPKGDPSFLKFVESFQFSTLLAMNVETTTQNILEYAKKINQEFPGKKTLIIDDGWMKNYGDLNFDTSKISDPAFLVQELKKMNFKVWLWIVPYVSLKMPLIKKFQEDNFLVKNSKEQPLVIKWWKGDAYVFNFKNQKVWNYIKNILQKLMSDYGISGFKFDGGEAYFLENAKVEPRSEAIDHNFLYSKFATQFSNNEMRTTMNFNFSNINQRLHDRKHSWDQSGINTLVPNYCNGSLMGYFIGVLDLIGGQIKDFYKNKTSFDQELFLRWLALAIFSPILQFSALPQEVLDKKHYPLFKKLMDKRKLYTSLVKSRINNYLKTGEPLWTFPEFYEKLPLRYLDKHSFMLGPDIFVFAIIEKNRKQRLIYLPSGMWEYQKRYYHGLHHYIVDIDLDSILIFKKIKKT